MSNLRFGINFGYWQNMKAENWPEWQDLINMDLDDLEPLAREDAKHRHYYEPSYHPSMATVARHSFPGLDRIRGSYSQSMQDIFVLTLLNGKTNGTYIEVGSFEPVMYNNTYLLTQFGWQGLSIDIDNKLQNAWEISRPTNNFINADAMLLDYRRLLTDNAMPQQIDYLQIDIDQGQGDVDVLQKLLKTGHRFSVITFEHETDWKIPSKKILREHGYELLVENIVCKHFAEDRWHVYEDWWVDPAQIDSEIQNKFRNINVERTYFFELFCQPGSVDHLIPPVLSQKDIWKNYDL